ncbi:hypothetical protein GUJ93_ZPchr0001g31829 [Zizania palustris]|uniref:Uncharacterized protein n=1 Tax=Zizania palustris TaxID=103762 RepID=A0A8J5RRI1_ZIZPA|nr:hypothetical protein GUJ93_ZPchr0001g31829 [Zizania palustris]
MPKGSKKRAKLRKKQQGGHPAGSDDGGGNNNNNAYNGSNNSTRRDAASDGNHLPVRPNIPHVDVSEDSMESSEEMVTPRASPSEVDEEERKAATSEVPVEVVDAAEEVMVDALPPEAEGKAEALVAVQEPEVKREHLVSKVHPVNFPEPKDEEVLVVETAAASVVQVSELKANDVSVTETAALLVLQEPETKGGEVVEVSRSGGAADTTEVARGPAVAVAAAGQRTTWWNCCGLFDAFSGSER